MYDNGHFNDITCDVAWISGSFDLLITRMYGSVLVSGQGFHSSPQRQYSQSRTTVAFKIRFPFRTRATRSSALITLHT